MGFNKAFKVNDKYISVSLKALQELHNNYSAENIKKYKCTYQKYSSRVGGLELKNSEVWLL